MLQTTQNVTPSSSLPIIGEEERSSMTKGRTPTGVTRDPLRAQKGRLYLILVVYGPESVLPEVLAIHTIEMIPKSMILEHKGFE